MSTQPHYGGGGQQQQSAPQLHTRKLFIKNLKFTVEKEDVRRHFEQFGTVKTCDLPMDGTKHKGIAFVEFESEDQARAARDASDNTQLQGRPIYVQFAEKKERSDNFSGGGGFNRDRQFGDRPQYGGGSGRGGYSNDRYGGGRDHQRRDYEGGNGGYQRGGDGRQAAPYSSGGYRNDERNFERRDDRSRDDRPRDDRPDRPRDDRYERRRSFEDRRGDKDSNKSSKFDQKEPIANAPSTEAQEDKKQGETASANAGSESPKQSPGDASSQVVNQYQTGEFGNPLNGPPQPTELVRSQLSQPVSRNESYRSEAPNREYESSRDNKYERRSEPYPKRSRSREYQRRNYDNDGRGSRDHHRDNRPSYRDQPPAQFDRRPSYPPRDNYGGGNRNDSYHGGRGYGDRPQQSFQRDFNRDQRRNSGSRERAPQPYRDNHQMRPSYSEGYRNNDRHDGGGYQRGGFRGGDFNRGGFNRGGFRGGDRGGYGGRGGFRGRGGRGREDDDVPDRHSFNEDKAKQAAAAYQQSQGGYDQGSNYQRPYNSGGYSQSKPSYGSSGSQGYDYGASYSQSYSGQAQGQSGNNEASFK